MRTKNATRNILISLMYELVLFGFGILMPRFIILAYGSEVNGLTATINQILNMANLLQAGAIGASIYMMYKPVANKDNKTINEIILSSKKYFTKIGYIYLLLSITIGVITSFYLKSEGIALWEIIVSFAVLSFAGSTTFFFISTSDILLSSFQSRWLLSVASTIERLVYYGFLFLVVFTKSHFILMYVGALLGRIVQILFLKSVEYKKFGNILDKSVLNSSLKIPNRGYLLFTSIGDQIVISSPTLLITYILDLTYSSVYSLYAFIYTSMITIINSIQLSISAIFGNLVSSENNKEIERVFNLILYFFIIFGSFLASCTIFLFIPFITLYTKGVTDVNYIYPSLSLLITLCIIAFSIKIPYTFISNIYGFFKITYKIILLSGIIGVFVAFAALILFGMPYVIMGVLIYHVLVIIIIIYHFRTLMNWNTTYKLRQRLMVSLILPLIYYIVSNMINIEYSSWSNWIITAFICALSAFIVLFIYSFLFENNEIKQIKTYLFRIIRKEKV